jgi:mono/diheme cytochrome c family protein
MNQNLGPKHSGGGRLLGLLLGCTFVILLAGGGVFYLLSRPTITNLPAESASLDETGQLATGAQLFGNYCAPCHGDKGDGNGPAARFLYPKPRNFSEGKFRIVSTVNRMPTDSDLMQVISQGMPGSAMFPFAHLSEDDRRQLVGHVRQLTREGIVAKVRAQRLQRGEEVDQAELEEDTEQLIRPKEAVDVLANAPAPMVESVAHGRQLYVKQCAQCHGDTGKGDGSQDQRDDNGMPTRPRDFTRGIFKSGRDFRQLYTRVRLGLPGSPMPSYDSLRPEEIGDIVNFVLSLSDPGAQDKFTQKRSHLLAKRAASPLVKDLSEQQWQAVEPVSIVVSPLWWRNYEPPDLQVQCLHDGNSLAIRLTWHDDTANLAALRPQDFEDMAAVQFFRGKPEPFLGMGAANNSVDVWLWNAGRSGKRETFADVETAHPNMAVDFYPFEKRSKEDRGHPLQLQPPEFLTARAAGNLRSDPGEGLSATGLTAKGFGTLTMRPRVSQSVRAVGAWADRRWTVVLHRPLQVEPDAGLNLAPHDLVSIAFAIWDGAARDRDGQKLVSVWHDLELE